MSVWYRGVTSFSGNRDPCYFSEEGECNITALIKQSIIFMELGQTSRSENCGIASLVKILTVLPWLMLPLLSIGFQKGDVAV